MGTIEMVGIQGVGGVPEPKPERPAGARGKTNAASASASSESKDGVVISSEAHAAASIAKTIQSAKVLPDLRSDRVEAAKVAIERGDFKNPDIVAKVAERIVKLL